MEKSILYALRSGRKHKVWQDGRISQMGQRLILYGENGERLGQSYQAFPKPGETVNFDRYTVLYPLETLETKAPVQRIQKPQPRRLYFRLNPKAYRNLRIPNSFLNIDHYRKILISCLWESLQITVSEARQNVMDLNIFSIEIKDVFSSSFELAIDDLLVCFNDGFENCVFIRTLQSGFNVDYMSINEPPTTQNLAIRICNSSEFSQIQVVENFESPILDLLLRPKQKNYKTANEDLVLEFKEKFQLNQEQTNVLQQFSNNISQPLPSILLVHGVFGSGKSNLCAVMVLLLLKISKLKILLTSNTNVAVDRILECLLDLKFTDFVRIGCKKKISLEILKFHSDSISQVVGATCLATLLPCFEGNQFEVVILDEASQFTEPMSLIPLRLGAKHVILLGDPLQLPPTIQSRRNHQEGLEKTMFERLKFTLPCCSLFTQYRCHETIAKVPNTLFYQGKLKMGSNNDKLISDLHPIVFVDVEGKEEQKGLSFVNLEEINVLNHVFEQILYQIKDPTLLGVVSPYKAQAEALSSELQSPLVLINTIDAFQGSEKQVILVSCVRTNQIGFSDDPRRLNVMLTRARSHLLIFGNRKLLSSNPTWSKVLESCRDIPQHYLFNKKLKRDSIEIIPKKELIRPMETTAKERELIRPKVVDLTNKVEKKELIRPRVQTPKKEVTKLVETTKQTPKKELIRPKVVDLTVQKKEITKKNQVSDQNIQFVSESKQKAMAETKNWDELESLFF